MSSIYLDFLIKQYHETKHTRGDSENLHIIKTIIKNPNFQLCDIQKYQSILFGDLINKCYNPNWVTINEIRKNICICNWNWVKLTINFINSNQVDLILLNDDLPWSYHYISISTINIIPIEYIIQHSSKNWNWKYISSIVNSLDIINDNPTLPWDYRRIINNFIIPKYITFKISGNSIIHTYDKILETKENLWFEIKEKICNLYFHYQINALDLSMDPNLTIDIINNHKTFIWDLKKLLKNPSIDKDILFKNKNYIDNVSYIITMSYVLEHLNYNWNWEVLSASSYIKMIDIENNLNLPWDWYYISENSNITIDFITKHIDKPFNWQELSININIKDIEKYLHEN